MKTLQRSSVVVPASLGQWIDTGVVVGYGESLRVQTVGRVKWGGVSGANYSDAFPEGIYLTPGDYDSEDVPATLSYGALPSEWHWPVTNTVPLGLAVAIVPGSSGNLPPDDFISDGLRPNRDSTFNGQSGRVWLRFNGPRDAAGTDFSQRLKGQFFAVIERLANASTLPAPRGGRFVPLGLRTHLHSSSQTPAWCWVIKPKNGGWEAYTTLDENLECPSYTSPNGENFIPALTYRCGRGIDLSQIPCTLKMEADGADVTVLGFDRKKIESSYYDDAEIEIFELNWDGDLSERWIAFSGRFGTAQVGEMSAQVELVSWEEIASKPSGEKVTYGCRFKFGGRGCRVEEINSGIVLADWTRAGTVVSATGNSKVRVRLSGVSLGSDYSQRLGEGVLTLTNGDLVGVARDIKRGVAVAGTFAGGAGDYDLELHVALRFEPAVGDTVAVSAGCEHIPTACKAYDNWVNYGGFPYSPQRDEVNRQG